MPDPAPHFSPKALTFLRQLKKNNDRAWFAPRKAVFEAELRGPLLGLVEWLNGQFQRFAVDHVSDPKRAMYRIYRDTRFSHDKTPYKDHVGAMFGRRGLPKNTCAGFYVGVSPAGVEVAGGMYMPGPAELPAVRAAIAADPAAAAKVLGGTPAVMKLVGPLQGALLARLPKGFEHVADGAGKRRAEVEGLVRRKQWYFGVTLDAELATTPRLGKEVAKRFEVMVPAVDFLNEAVLARKAEDDDDGERAPRRPEPMF